MPIVVKNRRHGGRNWSFGVSIIATQLLLLAYGSQASDLSDADQRAIETVIQRIVSDWPLPGVAVSVFDRNDTLFVRGFGVTSIVAPRPVDKDTLFLINSNTKSITATVLATLVDEHELHWADSVKRYLDWFETSDPIVTRMLSIEDILTHRTGIECNDWMEDIPGLSWRKGLERHRYLPLVSPFRTRFEYCNWVFSLSGLIVASFEGSWEAAVQSRVFDPLGMHRSIPVFERIIVPSAITACHECELKEEHHGRELVRGVANVASPHVDVDGTLARSPWRRSAPYASGSVLSSATDLTRYGQLYLNEGRVGNRRVVSKTAIQDLVTPRIPVNRSSHWLESSELDAGNKRTEDWIESYGYGWALGHYERTSVIHHGGASLGFESSIVIVPELGIGIVVLSNYNHRNGGAVDAITWSVLDRVLQLEPIDWTVYFDVANGIDRRQAASEWRDILKHREETTKAVPTAVAGHYCHPAYGLVEIAKRPTGNLELNQGPERWGTLMSIGGGRFQLNWNGPRNENRLVEVDLATGNLTIGDVAFKRCHRPTNDPDTRSESR